MAATCCDHMIKHGGLLVQITWSAMSLTYLFLLLLGDESLDGFSLLELLLHLDEESYTVNDKCEKSELRVSQTISVGDIVNATNSSGVNTTCSTLLEAEFVKHIVQLGLILGEVGDLDVDTSTESSTKVRWAGQDEAKMLVPHELLTLCLHGIFKACKTLAEPAEDFLDVSTLLHTDNTEMILLINPDQEALLIVMPDTTGIRPVTCHTSAAQQGRHGLVKQEVISNELILLSVCHLREGIVLALEFSIKTSEHFSGDLLNLTTFTAGAEGWQAKTTDATTSTDTAGEDVVGVEFSVLESFPVEVSLVLGIRAISTMTLINYGVHEVLEDLVALLITSDTSDSHDERVTWIVDSSLDGLVNRVAVGCAHVTVFSVHSGGKDLSHEVVVFCKVREISCGSKLLLVKVSHVCRVLIRPFL